MMNVIERRPFSELGDQQLLDQTRRLAANQRCIEVHILDHLDEIDRRGLALRRGFSSLFDYAVRELRFTDAAAQRRIQAMRLCRRHGWVRASLQSGDLSMTSAGQLETTFAGAERAERQSDTGHRNVGQGRGHDQDHDSTGRTRQLGLPAAPGEAGEQGERGPQSAPELVPPAGECSGDAAAMNTLAEPVASHAAAQDRGATHAGALLRRPELNGNAAPFPASSCDAVAVPVAGPAAPSSDEGPAPRLLQPKDQPKDLPASAPVAKPVQVVAPSESRHTASCAPELPRDDSFAELSPGTVSAASLLHPQRQRELIEQAAGMSTRQVAVLLAAAAPEVVPPRDTLRAVAPDRYTLKATIDQECEQGLRLLKDLMSHLDPRMSWGDLVARVVREAVVRHDPRGGGNGHRRRRSAGSAGASPRRAPKETRAAGAAAGPAQRVNESSRRAPNRTCAVAAPAAPAQRGGGNTPAARGDTAAAERQNPIAMLANAAAPRQTAPDALADGALVGGAPSAASDALSDGARAGGVPSSAPAAAAAPRFAGGAAADGVVAGASVPVVTAAPELALAVSSDGELSGASAGAVAGAAADGVDAGAGVSVSPVVTSAPEPAFGASSDGGPRGASAGAVAGAAADGSHAGAGVSVTPVVTSAPEPAFAVSSDGGLSGASTGAVAGASADGVDAGAGVSVLPVVTSAPELALAVSSDGRLSGASAGAVAGASADGVDAGAGVSVLPVVTSAPEPAFGASSDGGPRGASAGAVAGASADGVDAGAGVSVSPVATSAPEPALGASSDGGPRGTSAAAVAGASADGSHPRAGARISPVATAAPEPALGGSPDGGPSSASARAAAHTTREPVHSRHQSPPRRHIPAAVRRHIWQRDGGRCCYRDPLTGRRDRPPAAGRRGGWPGAVQSRVVVLCSPQNAPRPRAGSAAGAPDVAPPSRCSRAARLRWPTACRWPGGDTLRSAASRACVFSAASSDPGRRGRCARASRCRGLPSTNSCRFRRSHPQPSPAR